jgi:hypothetical protein
MSIIFSMAPITSRLWKRLGRKTDEFYHGANERLELAPSVWTFSPRVISLPRESDRATGTMSHTTLAAIRALEIEGDHLHGATVAYRFDNALLADGCFYSNERYGVGRPGQRRRPIILSGGEDFDEAQLSTDMSSELYFGHWLCDGLCTELLAIDRKIPGLTYKRPTGLHESEYRQLLDIQGHATSLAKVKRLWVIDDRGINLNRADRFRRLRSRLRKNVRKTSLATSFVFISRGSSGVQRNLANEASITTILSGMGFDIIDPMKMTSMTIAESLLNAKVVISVEGSHSSHALLAMPPGGAILIIQPPERFLHSWKFFGDIVGLRYGFVVADPHPQGFSLEPDRLLRTLDLVMAAIR